MKRATYIIAIAIFACCVPFAFARGRGGSGGHAGGGHAAISGGHAYGGHAGGHGYGRGYGRGYGYGGRGYGYGGGYYGGFWPGFGLGWGLGYGLGWGYPYYGYGNAYPYDYSYPYDYGYPASPYYYGSAPPALSAPNAAPVRLDVIVPNPQAQIWLNGQLMQNTGMERDFVSSPVETGYNYTYKVRAVWNQNGQPVTVERNVQVTPGETTFVDFSHEPAGNGSAGSH